MRLPYRVLAIAAVSAAAVVPLTAAHAIDTAPGPNILTNGVCISLHLVEKILHYDVTPTICLP